MSDNYITENHLQTIERMMMRHTWQDVTTLKNEELAAMIGAIRGLRVTLGAVERTRDGFEAWANTLESCGWHDAGFCPHCHADELRQSTDLYDDELNLSVIVYRCGACGALWAGDVNEWVRLVKRLEAAEQQLMVYRVLLTGAMMAAAYASGLPPTLEPFANAYFTELFQVALDSGSFAEAGCGTTGILAAAEQLHVKFPFAEE